MILPTFRPVADMHQIRVRVARRVMGSPTGILIPGGFAKASGFAVRRLAVAAAVKPPHARVSRTSLAGKQNRGHAHRAQDRKPLRAPPS